MKPARSILDRSFRYVPAVATSVVETWRRFGWRPMTVEERKKTTSVVETWRRFGWRPMTDEERKKRRHPTAEAAVESIAGVTSLRRAARTMAFDGSRADRRRVSA